MSKILASLLGQSEEAVAKTISTLEDYCGYPSHDVRLLAEINQICRSKTADLKLDPDDTKGRELYHSLLNRLQKDASRLRPLNLAQSDTNLTSLIKQLDLPAVWVIKHSVAKDLLRARPSKRLMRFFNCRSVDSMLKRQNIDQLYSLLPVLESSRYLANLKKAESRLTINDFEQRPITLVRNSQTSSNQSVTTTPEMGVIAVWQPTGRLLQIPGMQVLYVLLAIEELLLCSSLIKLKRSQPDFGRQLVDILHDKNNSPASLAGQLVPWSCVVRHFAHQPAEHQQHFEPYLTSEDFHPDRPLEQLANIHPAFRWWSDSVHTAAYHQTAKPVSLNLVDVLQNYLVNNPYQRRTFEHFRQALWQELFGRYLKHTTPGSNLNKWLVNSPAMENVPVLAEDPHRQLIEIG